MAAGDSRPAGSLATLTFTHGRRYGRVEHGGTTIPSTARGQADDRHACSIVVVLARARRVAPAILRQSADTPTQRGVEMQTGIQGSVMIDRADSLALKPRTPCVPPHSLPDWIPYRSCRDSAGRMCDARLRVQAGQKSTGLVNDAGRSEGPTGNLLSRRRYPGRMQRAT